MTVRFDGRVAIVTGAGGGLGRQHALGLAKRGAKVVVNDLGGTLDVSGGTPSAALAVVEEIHAAGGQAIASGASVTDFEAVKTMVGEATSRWGRVDILVNNAGILRDKTFAKMTLEDFEAVLAVHLMGTVYCTHAAWPLMLEQGYGRVVVTTSGSATNGNFGQSNYAAAKLGVVGLMNVLALEGMRKGVLINAIAPGAATRMTSDLIPGEIRDYLAPGLVSPVVAYLSSESCTDTGCIIWSVAGKVARVFYAETPGVQFDPGEPLEADDIEAAWPRIVDVDGAQPAAPGPIGDAMERLARMGLIG